MIRLPRAAQASADALFEKATPAKVAASAERSRHTLAVNYTGLLVWSCAQAGAAFYRHCALVPRSAPAVTLRGVLVRDPKGKSPVMTALSETGEVPWSTRCNR